MLIKQIFFIFFDKYAQKLYPIVLQANVRKAVVDRVFSFLKSIRNKREKVTYAAVSLFAFSLFSLIIFLLSDISGSYERLQKQAWDNGVSNEIWDDYFSVVVKKNGNLTDALTKAGVDYSDAKSAVESVKQISSNINPGQEVMFSLASQEKSEEIRLASLKIIEPQREIEVIRDDNGTFVAKEKQIKSQKKMLRAGGTIHNSIYQTGIELGVPAALMLEIIKAYSYDVDFQRDIQSGDSFEILYEIYVDGRGKKVRDGNIVFASLQMGNDSPIKIYRHKTKDGDPDYYNEDGKSIRKALLRTPINGARISSRFGMRMHPVLGYSKMHKGIDFAAPKGTPIYAAGNGVVDFKGWKGGYGNFLKIRHGGDYSTAYGHISRFANGINRGTRVKQGQVVAYVGSTGRSTGPHLHYETHLRGAQVNPMKIKNMPGTKLAGPNLAAFKKHKKEIEFMLASLPLNSGTVALNTKNSESSRVQ